MYDHYYGLGKSAVFLLNHKPDEEAAELISELNDLLVKMGCGKIEVEEHVDTHDNTYYPVLYIRFNAMAAAGYNRRDAGRRRKPLSGERLSYKVGEVKKMLEEKTADEVARDLGISRSTLFRRLKDRADDYYF